MASASKTSCPFRGVPSISSSSTPAPQAQPCTTARTSSPSGPSSLGGHAFLVSISNTFLQVAISRGLHGIGITLVVPSIQSLVADSTNDGTRDLAFGWLELASNLGLISGGFVGLLLA
ncbi:hypothetical protein PR202_gb00467 [Eleusine coracana subsp. coracana]|uniref:Major facilitator superfamily (MFS) profile domain-containing protein n=1 Tax=Eleusine coracana subsp. coracana TaxID=191504 RepID=A0AAV5DTZ0_ELECO|nr:hypothetical protein PR202_gb00467 [Eleusine coracana subsp. coracana]